jgi:hypothetical protein
MEPRNLNETVRLCFACGCEVGGEHDHEGAVRYVPLAFIPPELRAGGFDDLDDE